MIEVGSGYCQVRVVVCICVHRITGWWVKAFKPVVASVAAAVAAAAVSSQNLPLSTPRDPYLRQRGRLQQARLSLRYTSVATGATIDTTGFPETELPRPSGNKQPYETGRHTIDPFLPLLPA